MASVLCEPCLQGNLQSLISTVHSLRAACHIPPPLRSNGIRMSRGRGLERAQPQAQSMLGSATETTTRQGPSQHRNSTLALPEVHACCLTGNRRYERTTLKSKEKWTLAQLHVQPGHCTWLAPAHQRPDLSCLACWWARRGGEQAPPPHAGTGGHLAQPKGPPG